MDDYDVKFYLWVVAVLLLIFLPAIALSCETIQAPDVTLESETMTNVTNIKK